ncbi:MAG: FHA domain-containing protein [Planctomycetota bacterium]
MGRVSLDGDPFTIGRSSSNALVLSHRTVSRTHCVIECHDGAPRLRDLDSRYGTMVNGRRIDQVLLRHGDRVRVGPFELTWIDPDAAEADPAATPAESAIDADADDETLEARRAALEAAEADLEQRRAALEQAEAALGERRAEHDAVHRRAEETRVQAVRALRERIRELEAERMTADRRADAADKRVARMKADLQRADDASRKLHDARRSVEGLEAEWLASNDRAETDHDDPRRARAARQRQESVGRKLEKAQDRQDQAFRSLRSTLGRIRDDERGR